MDDLLSKHKKEVKAHEGAKRSALKKAKGVKGKKGKEMLAAAEEEFAAKEKEMLERHKSEISALSSSGTSGEEGGGAAAAAAAAAGGTEDGTETPASAAAPPPQPKEKEAESEGDAKRRKAREKALRKKQKAKEKERQREKAIAEELANAGPSRRQLEMDALNELYLSPANLRMTDVEADGNCLYRAVAVQCPDSELADYGAARNACADALVEWEEDFAPFAETDSHGSYSAYVERVRSSSDWGGHLELRALSRKLRRVVVVYSAEAPPLRMGEEFGEGEEIRLSFHRHYYALGEHYNAVVPK